MWPWRESNQHGSRRRLIGAIPTNLGMQVRSNTSIPTSCRPSRPVTDLLHGPADTIRANLGARSGNRAVRKDRALRPQSCITHERSGVGSVNHSIVRRRQHPLATQQLEWVYCLTFGKHTIPDQHFDQSRFCQRDI